MLTHSSFCESSTRNNYDYTREKYYTTIPRSLIKLRVSVRDKKDMTNVIPRSISQLRETMAQFILETDNPSGRIIRLVV